MLRKIRVTLAIIFFVLLTLLFLDFSGILHGWFGWMARVQFVPAILAVNLAIVAILILLTLIFGRVYCSVICPLGVLQDGVSNVAGRVKKNRFSYSPAISWLRWAVLGGFIISLVAGVAAIVSLLEPYSAYGRIASNFFAPFYRWGNNLLAYLAGRVDSYAFYSVEVWMKSWITFFVALLTLGVVGFLAWRNGRTYCNTICPVGTVLGYISRFSLLKPVLNKEKCTQCSLCERNCKASCIDYKSYKIDYSRCVSCMNCIEKCRWNAITYKPSWGLGKTHPEATPDMNNPEEGNGMTRRGFLSVAAFFAASQAIKAQLPVIDGGLAVIEDKKVPDRQTPITPPGSRNNRHIKQHCTACQLCVSACPNNILHPSGKLETFMQPEMTFERGYCRPECVRCSEVCPTGAIKRITTAEKSALQIGRAQWISQNCIVNRDERTCTSCERHCPTGAIELVPRDAGNPDSLKIPIIDTESCIGCGACEYLCPARPLSAIYVEGNTMHRTV